MHIFLNCDFEFFIIPWIAVGLISAEVPCAEIKIESPAVTNGSLDIQEFSTISIYFSLIYNNCSKHDSIKIEINKVNKNDGVSLPQCNIVQKYDNCIREKPINNVSCTCICMTSNGPYLFTKTIENSDNTSWEWSTEDSKIETVKITFNVISRQATLPVTQDTYNDCKTLWVIIILVTVSFLSVCNSVMIGTLVTKRRRKRNRLLIANGSSSGLPCVYPINNPQDRSHLMARAVSWESFDTDNDIFSWHSSYLHPVQPTGMFSRQITLGSNPVYENDEDEY